MRLKFLYCPVISWNFKSANNSHRYTQFDVCTTAPATKVVLFVSYSLTKMRRVNIKAGLTACNGVRRVVQT
jgi:hypothetical protein